MKLKRQDTGQGKILQDGEVQNKGMEYREVMEEGAQEGESVEMKPGRKQRTERQEKKYFK